MSSYLWKAINPVTGKMEEATFIDDHYGPHLYGIKFTDGYIYPETEVEVPPLPTSTPVNPKEQ